MAEVNWNSEEVAASFTADPDRINPARSEQVQLLVEIVEAVLQEGDCVLDLGCGSGLVDSELLARIPDLRIVGVDASAPMLALARERLAAYGERMRLVMGDLRDLSAVQLSDARYGIAIATQSLHHLSAERMRDVYRFVRKTLRPGGWFVLLDRMQIASDDLWAAYQAVWKRSDRLFGSTQNAHEGGTFAEHVQRTRERGDFPRALREHLEWLTEAGFEADVLHALGARALIVARTKLS
ncbi:MAG: methyltransferase domain-containing protein [Firmicutes bacterium]|nr:methyltransferase domain-containing protein [Bacillota bacterium]